MADFNDFFAQFLKSRIFQGARGEEEVLEVPPEQEFLLQRRKLLQQHLTHLSRRKFSSLQGKMVVCRKEFATFYKQVGRLFVSFLIVGVVSVTHLCLFRTAARVTRVVGITTEETRVSFALISTTTRYGCQQV